MQFYLISQGIYPECREEQMLYHEKYFTKDEFVILYNAALRFVKSCPTYKKHDYVADAVVDYLIRMHSFGLVVPRYEINSKSDEMKELDVTNQSYMTITEHH